VYFDPDGPGEPVVCWARRGVGARDGCAPGRGEVDVDAWWWIPIGLVAWFALSVAVGLWLGPVLKSCSQARDAPDRHGAETVAVSHEPPRDWRQAC
jgi:hypothetical protein